MEAERSSPYPQVPATCPYPTPARFNLDNYLKLSLLHHTKIFFSKSGVSSPRRTGRLQLASFYHAALDHLCQINMYTVKRSKY